LRYTCYPARAGLQNATKLIYNNLSTDNILSVTQSCHHFSVSRQTCDLVPVRRLWLTFILNSFKNRVKNGEKKAFRISPRNAIARNNAYQN
jgi:hypothetical protein